MGFIVCLLTGLAVGLAPILASSHVRVQVPGNASPGLRMNPRVTVHRVMVSCQIAVSLVMLIGAALFVQSLRNLSSVDPGLIVSVIGWRGLTLVATGLGIGALGALGFTRTAGALLYGVTTNTGATLGMSVLLAVVSLMAIYVPARAATRLDSVRAIRYD